MSEISQLRRNQCNVCKHCTEYLGQRYLGQAQMRGGGILVKTMVILMFGVHKGRRF